MTMEATIAQTLFTAAMLLIFGGFLFWAVRTHQFRDAEEANRALFGGQGPDRSATPDDGEVPL
jgi:cbb3-type cytochrome oxidase subunit 3